VEAHLERCPTSPAYRGGQVGAHAGLVGARDPDSVVPPALQARLAVVLTESHGPDAR